MSKLDFTTEATEFTEARQKLNAITEAIIGAAIDVHRALGPGLLESAYEMCLCREMTLRDLPFERQRPVAVEYKGIKLDCGYRADLIVANAVLVEVKAVETLLPIHEAQLLSYLRLSGIDAGLLINFNERLLKHGIKRRLIGDRSAVSF
ncbi:MAG: GxxExxY protein [Verrucomicrobiota bacterium]|nr:GxxExxY protein [Verrucomicrobiota bacterium]